MTPIAEPGFVDHLLALVLGLLLPLAAVAAHRSGPPELVFDARERIATYWSNAAMLLFVGAAALGAGALGGRPVAALGLRWPAGGLAPRGLFVAALVVALYALDTALQLATPARRARTRARWRERGAFLPTNRREQLHSLVLCAAAAVGEELAWRGFLIAWLAHFTGAAWPGLALALALPALAFAAAHLYQGAAAAAKVAGFAFLLGLAYVWLGTLWIPIAIHFAVDVVGMALAPRLLGQGHAPARGFSSGSHS